MFEWKHLIFDFPKKKSVFFKVGPKFGYKFRISGKCLIQIFGKDFDKLYVQLGEKFQCTDNLGTL